MFHLINQYGNVHKKVESERKRDELIALGYHEVKVPAEEGAQAAAGGDNTTENDAQTEVNLKKGKTKKNVAEE